MEKGPTGDYAFLKEEGSRKMRECEAMSGNPFQSGSMAGIWAMHPYFTPGITTGQGPGWGWGTYPEKRKQAEKGEKDHGEHHNQYQG